jgi:glycosyltransferase involved in cell wall biosynthesis
LDKDQFEILLVLDGVPSIDSAFAQFSSTVDLRIFPLKVPIGRSAARNIGLRQARGEVIVSLDADMVPSPHLLETYYGLHKLEELVCIGTRGFIRPFPGMSAARKEELEALLATPTIKPDYRTRFYERTRHLKAAAEPFWAFSTCNCSYRLEAALRVGGFDENLSGWGLEDQEFGYNLWGRQIRFVHSQAAYAVHIEHPRDKRKELVSWIRNREYCVSKHGPIFSNPYNSMRHPPLHQVVLDPAIKSTPSTSYPNSSGMSLRKRDEALYEPDFKL